MGQAAIFINKYQSFEWDIAKLTIFAATGRAIDAQLVVQCGICVNLVFLPLHRPPSWVELHLRESMVKRDI